MLKIEYFLTGVKVLDLSQYIPGPGASLMLADMGANVVKVEPPHGDPMQALGPRDEQDRPVFHRALNAGKTIIRLDLKDPDQRQRFLALVVDADVLIEGFRPDVMARLGIDYPVLKKINPRLIMCSISGYGPDSALGGKAGHDANYLALSGILDRNGDRQPNFFDPPISDAAGSMFAAMAILGALHGRGDDVEGCVIDLALADTLAPLQAMELAGLGAGAAMPRRRETYLNGGAAYNQVYRIGDGAFGVLCAVEPRFWARFCAQAGRPDWLERHGEPLPQDALVDDLRAFFAALSRDEAERRFEAADCCFSIVLDLGEALAHPRVCERDLVRRNSDGDLQALFPARIDGAPPPSRRPPRFLDENKVADVSESAADEDGKCSFQWPSQGPYL